MYSTRAMACKHGVKRLSGGVQGIAATQRRSQQIVHFIAAIPHVTEQDHPAGVAKGEIARVVVKRRQVDHGEARSDMRPDFRPVGDEIQDAG